MSAKTFLGRFFDKFFKDETTTLAASLSFYTALSLAPLVILFVAISAHLSEDLIVEFLTNTRALVGEDAAQAVQIVIDGARSRTDLTSVAGWIGAGTLLVSASLIFGQLRVALNRIFGVQPPPAPFGGVFGVIVQFVRERLMYVMFALVCVLAVIVTLLASSVLSATVASSQRTIAQLITILASTAFYSLMFTLLFRYLPDRRQPWRSAFRGGVITALLFEVGKELIALYLGKSAIGSAYGAAGSLIVLLVWVYYSTLITFVGAQVSSILMRFRGGAS